jgi:hypothetical protein
VKRPTLSAERYEAIVATLAQRGYLRGVERPPEPRVRSNPFEDIDPYMVVLDFGVGDRYPFIEPDGYYDVPLRIAA